MPLNRLRDYRKARGLSLRQLAQQTGVGYSHLSKIETGEGGASDDRKILLASYFGVSIGELFFGEGVDSQETGREAVA